MFHHKFLSTVFYVVLHCRSIKSSLKIFDELMSNDNLDGYATIDNNAVLDPDYEDVFNTRKGILNEHTGENAGKILKHMADKSYEHPNGEDIDSLLKDQHVRNKYNKSFNAELSAANIAQNISSRRREIAKLRNAIKSKDAMTTGNIIASKIRNKTKFRENLLKNVNQSVKKQKLASLLGQRYASNLSELGKRNLDKRKIGALLADKIGDDMYNNGINSKNNLHNNVYNINKEKVLLNKLPEILRANVGHNSENLLESATHNINGNMDEKIRREQGYNNPEKITNMLGMNAPANILSSNNMNDRITNGSNDRISDRIKNALRLNGSGNLDNIIPLNAEKVIKDALNPRSLLNLKSPIANKTTDKIANPKKYLQGLLNLGKNISNPWENGKTTAALNLFDNKNGVFKNKDLKLRDPYEIMISKALEGIDDLVNNNEKIDDLDGLDGEIEGLNGKIDGLDEKIEKVLSGFNDADEVTDNVVKFDEILPKYNSNGESSGDQIKSIKVDDKENIKPTAYETDPYMNITAPGVDNVFKSPEINPDVPDRDDLMGRRDDGKQLEELGNKNSAAYENQQNTSELSAQNPYPSPANQTYDSYNQTGAVNNNPSQEAQDQSGSYSSNDPYNHSNYGNDNNIANDPNQGSGSLNGISSDENTPQSNKPSDNIEQIENPTGSDNKSNVDTKNECDNNSPGESC